MKLRVCLVCALAMMVLAASLPLFAATENALVYGYVYDSAGNPAPGINVSLENTAIGFSKSAVTGADGSYNFVEVPPAENYVLSASRNGTAIASRGGIVVNVADEKIVLPPLQERAALAPTATPEAVKTVKVAGQAITNEVTSTAISGVITGEQLRALPVAINRNFLNAGLIPPNTHDVEQGSLLAGASFSISGNRPQTNSFLLDGADNVASSTNQAVPFQVNDSVQEFRVTSATANAEYGRNMGGVVNIVTKRATNGFHGNVFGYFNNDALNSSSPLSVYNGTTFDKAAAYAGPTNSAFTFLPQTYNQYVSSAKALGFCTNSISLTQTAGSTACGTFPANVLTAVTGLPVPQTYGQNTFFDPASILKSNDSHAIPFDSKQFGGNAGGALIKDKWFAFGSYEGTLIDNPNPIFERVPSAFDRTYNPYGSPLMGFSPTDANFVMDQKILGLYPKSNVIGVPGVLEFFKGQAPNYTHVHNGLFRSDYKYSEKTNVSLRYVVQDLNQLHDDTLPRQSDYSGNGILRHALNQNLNATYEHSFNSNWVTDARVGYNRFALREDPQDQSFDARSIGFPDAGLPTILLNGLDPQYGGAMPGVSGSFAGWSDAFVGVTFGVLPTLDGHFPMARLGAPLGAPLDRRDTTWFAADNVSWTYGKHGVKFGWEFRHLDNRLTDSSFSRGFMYSGDIGEFTHDSESCNEVCMLEGLFVGTGGSFPLNAFLRPSFDFYQQQSSPYASRLSSFAHGGYIQDTWHVHRRVTVNYGVRWEYFAPPRDEADQLWNYDPVANGLVQEGQSSVVDPFGNPCGSPLTLNPTVPQVNQSGLFAAPVPSSGSSNTGIWNCRNQASRYNALSVTDWNNFAPRLGVAWDIFGTGKTVARAAIGYFYDQVPASYLSQLMYNRPTTAPNSLYGTFVDFALFGYCPVEIQSTCANGSTIVQPAVQSANSSTAALSNDSTHTNAFYSAATQPFAIYGRDSAHTNTPFSRQISASIQQQLTNNLTMEVGYIGSHGTDLPLVYNRNLANEANLVANAGGGNLALFPIYEMTNQGRSDYNSLMLRLRAAEWHGLRVNGTYIYSHSIDNASDALFPPEPLTMPNLSVGYGLFGQLNPVAFCIFEGRDCSIGVRTSTGTSPAPNPLTLPTINFSAGAVTTTGAGQIQTSRYLLPQDPFDFWNNDRGNSDFDIRHRVVVDYTYDVPKFSSAFGWPRWMDNWQLSGVVTAQSGQPFTVFAGPFAGEITQRVNLIGPVNVTDNPNAAISTAGFGLASQSSLCLNPTTGTNFLGNFLQPAPGVACTGNSGRNQFSGPNYVNTNFAIQKGFTLGGEGRMITFRTEFYNLFNRANYFNPISQFSVDGQTPNPDFGKIKSAHEPREIQFALRYSW